LNTDTPEDSVEALKTLVEEEQIEIQGLLGYEKTLN
jgi:hypothetical protein